jgi:hypothetical protein
MGQLRLSSGGELLQFDSVSFCEIHDLDIVAVLCMVREEVVGVLISFREFLLSTSPADRLKTSTQFVRHL